MIFHEYLNGACWNSETSQYFEAWEWPPCGYKLCLCIYLILYYVMCDRWSTNQCIISEECVWIESLLKVRQFKPRNIVDSSIEMWIYLCHVRTKCLHRKNNVSTKQVSCNKLLITRIVRMNEMTKCCIFYRACEREFVLELCFIRNKNLASVFHSFIIFHFINLNSHVINGVQQQS